MTFELTVLGSSSALPTSTKYPAAHVLNVHERFFLIDCGEGTQIQLRKAGIRFGKINHIFISHMHGDHVFGLPGLFSSMNLLGRKTPLYIYGPPEIRLVTDFYEKHFTVKSEYPIILHPLTRRAFQQVYEDKVTEIFAFPLKHRIPTYGFLFREKRRPLNVRKDKIAEHDLSIKQIQSLKKGEDITGKDGKRISHAELTEPPYKTRSFAYCSDTAFYRKNATWLNDTDLIFHEATFMEKDKELARDTGHSTASEAARFARLANAGKLLIGHFSNRYKTPDPLVQEARAEFENTFAAEEMKVYSIARTRDQKYP